MYVLYLFSLILQPVRINKPGAPLLGLAKSIYYHLSITITLVFAHGATDVMMSSYFILLVVWLDMPFCDLVSVFVIFQLLIKRVV